MSAKEYLVCLDAGTTSVKAVVFDEAGGEVSSASAENELVCDRMGFVELDMDRLWTDAAACIRKAIDGAGVRSGSIRAVAVCGQGEGCWLVGADGRPVSRAILWNDNRAADIVGTIRRDKALYDEVKRTTGSYPRPGAAIVLLKWFKENRPEEFANAAYALSCKDWLRYKLTSEFFCEATDASTSYIDIVSKEFPTALFEKLGIGGAERLFPKMLLPSDAAGRVTRKAAEDTGLPSGACVCAGMLDIVSTAVGAGAIRPGDICTILGTSCVNETVTDAFVFEENMTGWERHLVDGLFVNVAGAMAGTPNLDWALKHIVGMKEFDRARVADLEAEISRVPVGANGLLYHPYLSPAGERAPFFDTNAAGHLSGIKTSTNDIEILRSVYEGVALSAKDCLSGFKGKRRLYLTGGGSRSAVWAQIFADCVGCEVSVGDGEEFCAKGGAVAAALASGMHASVDDAVGAFCRTKRRYEPDGGNARKYEDIYGMFKQMRTQFGAYWEWRADFLKRNS